MTNSFITLLSIVSVISLWKIFADRGIEGWKSLVPCLNDILLGESIGEGKLGRKLALAKGLLMIFFSLLLVMTMAIIAPHAENFSVGGTISEATMDEAASFMFLGCTLLAFSAFLAVIVFQIRFCAGFVRYNNAQSWLTIVWIICPALAEFYFAFIHEKFDIPGLTFKK